ncbi:hypothetical protein IEQ34_002961 [Dendrobium chrysotoxum]|uniref:Nucleolar protein 10 n=1 Tax=Dendrobium chrysotoxum TaxID=161865 RepID=A0AAV7HKF7_DENCH|nr:hypothetical protein IEQ34_002961 [Dendrobium chrysotoxum]
MRPLWCQRSSTSYSTASGKVKVIGLLHLTEKVIIVISSIIVSNWTLIVMYLQFYINDNGDKVYTTKKESPLGVATESAHPARFSPDDKYSRQRVLLKKRFGLLPTQKPSQHSYIDVMIDSNASINEIFSFICFWLENFDFYFKSFNTIENFLHDYRTIILKFRELKQIKIRRIYINKT